jgi:hypothetical protein
MDLKVGDIIGFICDYKHTKIEGQVLRILEKVNGLRPRLFLVQSQGVKGPKQWVSLNRVFPVMSEG